MWLIWPSNFQLFPGGRARGEVLRVGRRRRDRGLPPRELLEQPRRRALLLLHGRAEPRELL